MFCFEEIDSIESEEPSDIRSTASVARLALLLQELNSNLNEVVF